MRSTGKRFSIHLISNDVTSLSVSSTLARGAKRTASQVNYNFLLENKAGFHNLILLLRKIFNSKMDLVSSSYNSLPQKKNVRNGFHCNGNGINRNGMNGSNGIKSTDHEFGHSDFMKIQRYQDLIGRARKIKQFFNSILSGETPLVDITSLASPKVPGVKVKTKKKFFRGWYCLKTTKITGNT